MNQFRRSSLFAVLAAGTFALASACSDDEKGNREDAQDGTSAVEVSTTAGETDDDETSATLGNSSAEGGLIELSTSQLESITQHECTGVSVEVENIPAVLQLVVDVSLSMNDPAPGGGGTKWDVTHQALLDAIDKIPGSVAVGLQTYPNDGAPISQTGSPQTNPGCVSDIGRVAIDKLGGPGSAQRQALTNQLSGVELLMGTPTHDAYSYALDNGLRAYEGVGSRFMLLITDGAPTQLRDCGPLYGDQAVDTQPIIETMTEAASEGIRTFAIGSPGSEQGRAGDMREWLSHAALIGGTALPGCSLRGPDFCHFDMSQADDFGLALAEGLSVIASQVANLCTFQLPEEGTNGESVDLDATNVIIEWGDGQASLAQRDTEGSCDEGWSWNEQREIVLCDSTCAAVNADPRAVVTISSECDQAAIDDIVR